MLKIGKSNPQNHKKISFFRENLEKNTSFKSNFGGGVLFFIKKQYFTKPWIMVELLEKTKKKHLII